MLRAMNKPYRVLQVGLGPLGVKIANDLQRRRLGDVVAAIDPAPGLVGKSIADVVTGAPAGPTIVATLDEMKEQVDIAIVATVSDLRHAAPTLRALAERRISVVSTCEELSWPWDRHPELARELDAVLRKNEARLLGTGVNPGFVMDALAVAVSTACAEVRRVEIHRIQDASTRRIPFQKKIGATLSVEEFGRLAASGAIRHVGLRESVGMAAASLGLKIDRVDETIAPIVASGPMTCALGPIAAGAARGVHQEARAFSGGREVIALVFKAAIGEPDARDQVIVDGDPPIDLVIRGGLHGDIATSAVVLNSLRSVLAASPGLHTMTTIPMAGCHQR
jgi:4-hydroxy-tetrahydrodipicolinate reductase